VSRLPSFRQFCVLGTAAPATMRSVAVCALAASVALACKTDMDCSMAGICGGDGKCNCEAPFAGPSCAELGLTPVSCGNGGLCIDGHSTWGGGIMADDDGTLHMFSALMDDSCSLGAWLTKSRVLHAVSPSVASPFAPKEIVLGQRNASYWDSLTQHNPTVVRAPDGTWLIVYMGNHATDGQKAQNCTRGVSAGAVGGLPAAATTQRIGIASAPSPNGPWSREPTPVLEPGAPGAWDDLFVTNPTAHAFANGTVLLLFKGRSSEHPNGMFTGVAVADTWRGPYRKVGAGPIANVPQNCEDAGVFRGASTGRFFAVFHCGCNFLTVWSEDGLAWERSAPITPWCDVTFDDGSTARLRRRERPQFVLDASGVVVAMTNGVEPPSGLHGGRVFTMLSRVNASA